MKIKHTLDIENLIPDLIKYYVKNQHDINKLSEYFNELFNFQYQLIQVDSSDYGPLHTQYVISYLDLYKLNTNRRQRIAYIFKDENISIKSYYNQNE